MSRRQRRGFTISAAWKAAALAWSIANAAVAFAEAPAPGSVTLADGHALEWVRPTLVEVDAAHRKTSALHVPAALRHVLADASSVAFPASRSRSIAGHEYVLVVVNRSSSSRPTGYCGAGEEGTLHVLEIRGDVAAPRFSLPVQSCLGNLSLESDGGTQSPYLAIGWRDDPPGIDIRWEYRGDEGATHRVYRFSGGTFVEVGQ
ncbi:hypothetical protein ACVBGC_18410 [Burkholderia stagnalis]